jgi:hypothetical protein
MATNGTVLSFDVRDNRTIFYLMHSRVAESARSELTKQIRHVQQPGYKAMNPILETVGIVNLERSAVPEQKALGQLMGMVERLRGDIQDVQLSVKMADFNNMYPKPPLSPMGSLFGSPSPSNALAVALGSPMGLLNTPPPSPLVTAVATQRKSDSA